MKNLRQNKGESLIMTLCFVLLLLVPSVISAQNSNITGRVVDTQGEPIIGATVMPMLMGNLFFLLLKMSH